MYILTFNWIWSTSALVLICSNVSNADCPVSSCEWFPWEDWSECSRTCGTHATRYRYRSLCCPNDWIEEGTCNENCGKDSSGYADYGQCGDFCYNGGTLHLQCECHDRFYGDCCENRLPTCEPYPTDVIFLLDSSVSETAEEFTKQLDFVVGFIDEIEIGTEAFQIGVITFSTTAVVEVYPSSGIAKDSLKDRINQITFRPGATYTHKGLEKVLDIAQTTSERRPGMATLTYVIVLTDGMSTYRKKTEEAANTLKQELIHVIAIGVGQEVSHKELNVIASPADSYSESYVYSIGNFDALNTLIKRLVDITCPDCNKVDLTDVMFLIDERVELMSDNEFQTSVATLTHIIKNMDTFGTTNGQKVGVVHIKETGNEHVIRLSNDYSKDQMLAVLQTLYRTEGTCSGQNCIESDVANITNSIKYITNNYFNATYGGRDNARTFLLVASTGRYYSSDNIEHEISVNNANTDINIIALGPGHDVNMTGLLSIVTEPSHVYVTLGTEDMSHLDVLQSKFSYIKCEAKRR